MPDVYDAAVVGLGIIGLAAAAELADRGHSVLAFDRYHPPHPHGSSHGDTRMIREAYYLGSPYFPLVGAALDQWTRMEASGERPLLHRTGGLMIGPPRGKTFSGTIDDVGDHDGDYEVLSNAESRARFPAFLPGPDAVTVFEPKSAVLRLENCFETLFDRAVRRGAELRFETPVLGWRASTNGISIRTAEGEHRARRLVIAAGAWTPDLVPELGLPLEVERTVQYWFHPRTEEEAVALEPDRCPAWVWEYGPETTWYGFPRTGSGVKVGMHVQAGRRAELEGIDRSVAPSEETAMREVLRRFAPGIDGPFERASVCLYVNTPDGHFILDRHPEQTGVAIFAGGSGHAFKFAPVLAEALCDLVTDEPSDIDISHLSIARF